MTLSEVKALNRFSFDDGLTKEQFELRAGNTYIPMFFNMLNPIEKAVNFGVLMDKARELECADIIFPTAQNIMQQENCPELFELPDPELTVKKTVPLSPFPVNSLPKVLAEYLKAVSDDVQVYPEMCALPMLSVLSLCCQGKFEIELPNTSHHEPLNLYSVTIAKPGERKSGVFNSFTAPIYEYQSKENERRKPAISEYQANRAFLENQYHNAVKGKNASLERAKELKKELDELKAVNPLSLTANDCTAEAIAVSMSDNNGVMSIIDDECGVFDVISGLYSNGNSNIDIFLKAYDGTPVNIRRCAKQIDIKKPLITFGIMAQPKAFENAIGNPQFIGRGLIQRFIFSFPESKQGERTQSSPPVPENIKKAYNELIERLLNIPTPEKLLTLRFNRSASLILKDYYDYIEVRLKTGGQLEYMSEWANKLYAKCVRIAGLLHLCEYSGAEPVDEQTAQRAVNIAMWLENHAHKAFGGIEPDSDEITEKAKYILSRLKTNEYKVLTFREIVRLCRKIKKADDFTEPLALLEDKKYIREIPVEYLGKGQRPSPKYKINPLIYDKAFNSITA